MARSKILVLLVSAVFATSGCASLNAGRGALDDANLGCVFLGGIVGGLGGGQPQQRR